MGFTRTIPSTSLSLKHYFRIQEHHLFFCYPFSIQWSMFNLNQNSTYVFNTMKAYRHFFPIFRSFNYGFSPRWSHLELCHISISNSKPFSSQLSDIPSNRSITLTLTKRVRKRPALLFFILYPHRCKNKRLAEICSDSQVDTEGVV